MIKIYHNPRCRKSREGLQLLKESKQEFKIIEYLKEAPSFDELKSIIHLLGIPPLELIRKNESVWKKNYKGKELTNDEVIRAMTEHPKLIERPIVINKEKAVIGRPPENIEYIL
ncbi:arsenate reductase (glutaredoxin) [Flavobacteriaceae bacterium]|nr:arsenate reductase (glutaredoxin) [Flavobacteriaceae bacterium]